MDNYKKYVITNKLNTTNQIAGGKKEIYFIRHGETDWNLAARGQGQEADIPLNSTGKTQSITTGKYLNDYRQLDRNFDCIISSPMKRAYSTAKNIAKEIFVKRPIKDKDPNKKNKKKINLVNIFESFM